MKRVATREQVAVRGGVGRPLQRLGSSAGKFIRTQPLGSFGLVICVIVVLLAVFAPWVTRYDPTIGEFGERLQPPGLSHWLGTDQLGRDLYTRIVYGARISLEVSFFSIVLGTGSGYMLGLIGGYIGGKADMLFQRVVDAMLALPSILLALVMVAVLGPGLDKVIAAISITYLPRAARVSRGVSLSVKENVYIDASRVVGASPMRILLRHMLPNSLAPLLILASISLGGAILIEASLSYLGLGVPPPAPSWGQMLSGAAAQLALIAPWLLIFPGVAIMVLVLAFNLFGDTLRDLWDPKLRGRVGGR